MIMEHKEIQIRFDEKVKQLEQTLPTMKKGINCAELTLTNILDVLGVDDYKFHNLAMPLAGGFGGYKSKEGWQGACGAVAGGCAAIGVIMGGDKRMDDPTMNMAYLKAAKYAHEFEKQFGTVVCSKLCGHDFSTPEGMMDYQREGTWGKKCQKFVIWAVDRIRKETRKDLRNWE